MIADLSPRFFVSFSSWDISYVREIMAALQGQGLDFWDYSDIVQSIEAGETINNRLMQEIDICTHMIVVISRNSSDLNIGRFCRIELEYMLKKSTESKIHLVPVLLENVDPAVLLPPFNEFKNIFCCDLERTPESIVKFTVKVCQLIGKTYIPPIEAHQRLPFWRLFRKEVEELAHSNKEHVDLMIILGEFNEYYRRSEIIQALAVITYFIDTCNYRIKNYRLFYPLIVRAVCEEELEMYNDAMNSYNKAGLINPDNQDVIGGIGTVYFKKGRFSEAKKCFQHIIEYKLGDDVSNARINLIITKQAMEDPITPDEEKFLLSFNENPYPDDLKTNILNAQAIQLKIRGENIKLEEQCNRIINQNLHDTVTIRLLQVSFLNRWMNAEADDVIQKAIEESYSNPRLNRKMLESFLM